MWFKHISLQIKVAHHQKNIAQPYFVNFSVFFSKMCTRVVSYLKILKNSLGLLIFCPGCADLMPFSTSLCKKKHFCQELRDLGPFILFLYRQSRTTEGQKLTKWRS